MRKAKNLMTQCTSTINDVGVDSGGDHEGFSVRVRRDLATINLLPPRLYNRLAEARGNRRPPKNAKAQKV